MLQGKHITFSYSDSAKGKIDVLKDVSFEIREHDFIGLIGTSGKYNIDQASEWSAEGGIGRDLFQWGKYI